MDAIIAAVVAIVSKAVVSAAAATAPSPPTATTATSRGNVHRTVPAAAVSARVAVCTVLVEVLRIFTCYSVSGGGVQ